MNSVRVSRILHAGYLLESNGTQILFDPVLTNPFSHNCWAFPSASIDQNKVPQLDLQAVFISHSHDDHFCLESLNLLKRSTPIFGYSPESEFFALLEEMGFESVVPLRVDAAIEVGPFVVTPRLALDPDIDTLFQIEVAGLQILNVVDAWIDPEALKLLQKYSPWDLVLWPFQTLLELEVLSPRRQSVSTESPTQIPSEWLEQLAGLKPRLIVPSSCQFQHEPWSWYNQALFPISYAGFEAQLQECLPHSTVLRLNPGCAFTLSREAWEISAHLDWVLPEGPQNGDYRFDPLLEPPPMREVAQRFAALTEIDAELVQQFLSCGILARYEQLQQSPCDFWSVPRIWRLSVFDHQGQPTHFDYALVRSQMVPHYLSSGEEIAWCTEIAATKIHSALLKGESLTSLYLRINAQPSIPTVEKERQDADLLQDPLVRCLYEGRFAAFQKAQLRRLQGHSRTKS